MTKSKLSVEDIKLRALAILDPQTTDMANKFLTAMQNLKRSSNPSREWELQENAEKLVEQFVAQKVELVSNALHRVVATTGANVTERELTALFDTICPTSAAIQDVVFAHCRGVGIGVPGHRFGLDQAYERIKSVATAGLVLIAAPPVQPLKSENITKRFIAPDTNAFIHFTYVTEIEPSMVHSEAPVHWLILEQVIEELDDKARHKDQYYSRRARKLQRLIRSAADDPTAFGKGSTVTLFFPDVLPDLPGLDLSKADNRIMAQAIAFQQANTGSAVSIVTDDTTLIVRAAKFSLEAFEFPEEFRRPREDERDKQIRAMTARIEDLESSQPRLSLRLGEDEQPFTVTLTRKPSAEELEQILAVCREEERAIPGLMAHLEMVFTEAKDYDEKLQTYARKFPEYMQEQWLFECRTVKLSPRIRNDGVAAEYVDIDIEIVPGIDIRKDPGAEPTAPIKPPRYVRSFSMPWLESVANAHLKSRSFADAQFMRALAAQHVEPTVTGPRISVGKASTRVGYWRRTVRQHDEVPLLPMYLHFGEQDPPAAIEARYEIRARNANVVDKGKIVIHVVQDNSKQFFAQMLFKAGRVWDLPLDDEEDGGDPAATTT
jgi:hypothetical protein